MSELSETAVLCGNGSKAFKNAGNELFRHLVSVKKEEYQSSRTKSVKQSIAMSIIDEIKSQQPPGKFFEKNIKTGIWHVLDHKKAYNKTSQALRERPRTHADRKGAFHKKIGCKEYRCKNNLTLSSCQNSITCNSQKVDFHDFSEVSALHGKNFKTVIRREVDDERAYMNTSPALRELVHTHADKKEGVPQKVLELYGMFNPIQIYNEEELLRKFLQSRKEDSQETNMHREIFYINLLGQPPVLGIIH